LDENFADAAQEIYHSNGRLVVTGIGKALSLHKKWWPHLTPTGTPSLFLHASEAIQWDLGMVQKDDIMHFKSGNSPEIKAVVPFKTFCSTLIAITKHDFVSAKESNMY
jgi:arabinose-5-phosphate isomerase